MPWVVLVGGIGPSMEYATKQDALREAREWCLGHRSTSAVDPGATVYVAQLVGEYRDYPSTTQVDIAGDR